MSIIVQKYGGTSVEDAERVRAVAGRVLQAREAGHDVVVVVSAMGQTTDELLELANRITPTPEPRELDMLLTAGERIAMSLLAIALNARGCRAAPPRTPRMTPRPPPGLFPNWKPRRL